VQILVADACPLQRHFLRLYLSRLGLRARFVADSEGAIGEIYAERLDLVVVDLTLPEGSQLVEAARSQHPRAVIIGLGRFSAGVDAWLARPFGEAEFREVLGQCWRERPQDGAVSYLARGRCL